MTTTMIALIAITLTGLNWIIWSYAPRAVEFEINERKGLK